NDQEQTKREYFVFHRNNLPNDLLHHSLCDHVLKNGELVPFFLKKERTLVSFMSSIAKMK
ncbi:MAG: hypothetical protein J6X72_06615, partial [Clostridia bacterium]|nr:hypothetical protein [Clostridia bacterium]